MKVLITGGAGFVGSHTADRLIKEGYEVRILDNLVEQVHGGIIPSYLNNQCEFINGDVRNKEDVKKALKGIDYIFHLAARVGVGQSMYDISDYVSTNCVGTANLFEEIIESNLDIKKIIVASSMSIYGNGAYKCSNCGLDVYPDKRDKNNFDFYCPECGDVILEPTPVKEEKEFFPSSIYAMNKLDQEKYSFILGEAYNIPIIAFRYWNIYGTRQALSNPYTGVCAIFSSALLNDNQPTIFEDGNQTRDFVHIKDVVDVNYEAMINDSIKNDFFNIGSGHTISIKEVAHVLAKKMGKDIEPNITNEVRLGDVRNCIPDLSKARKILGFNPKYDLETGSQDLIDWVMSQHSFDKTKDANKILKQLNILN